MQAKDAPGVLQVVGDDAGSTDAAGSQMDANMLECTMWKLASICSELPREEVEASVTSSPAFSRLTSMMVLAAPQFNAAQRVHLLVCLAALGYHEAMAVDTLVSSCVECMEELGGRGLLLLVRSLLDLGGAPNLVVLDTIKSHLHELPPHSVQQQTREAIEAGLQALGHHESSPSQTLPPRKHVQADRAHTGADYE
jgi:hypothetical protein